MEPAKPVLSTLLERLRPIVYLSNNPLSLIGVVFVTLAGGLWLFLLPTLVRGEAANPYMGILSFLLLPGVFFIGLIFIPAGILIRRSILRRSGLPVTGFPPLTFESVELRRLVAFVAATTVANIIIAAQWGYSAVNYMDTDQFCGLTCHTVMQPEYTAYQNSPHSHVGCAECHIGTGASWFVKAKISGVRQVFAVALNDYERPIPSPVSNLRPARETCEQCHWPSRFSGDVFQVHTSYASGEQNQASYTVLLMKVGGQTWRGGVGIHGAHLDPKAKMVYTAIDEKRQTIPQVVYTAPDGKVTVFNATDQKVTPEQLAAGEHRVMDCMDCHNRPAHTFELPDKAVDLAMSSGHISPTLPFIKQQAVGVLKRDYADRDAAVRQIATSLHDFYQTKYPQIRATRGADIDNAIAAVKAIYLQNIFPEMKVTWGTYVNNLGHMDSPGCFRCHDGNHASADGKTIPNDCSTCHDVLAMEEQNPKILGDLGLKVSQ
ncbi:MAG TPA: NapC/NirT family cytochrome c [Bryobacteraceae bacterium]|nr:NapC/NirT family cytochrome c [Bryobacteraceae bacterium]